MKKIFLDVGHGGKDSGATSGSFIEKNMNMVTAKACCDELLKHNVQVKLSRTEDNYLSLTERANMANNWGADLFISCHYNAGGGDRGEVIHSVNKGTSLLLAQNIGESLRSIGQSTIKIYEKYASSGVGDYFTVIAASNMPAVIVEPCFIDNDRDCQLADTEETQSIIGVAIAKGILKTIGIDDALESEETEMIYNYIDDNMPGWARPAVQKLVDKGYLQGNDKGELGLNDTMLKIFVINDRAGLYDLKK